MRILLYAAISAMIILSAISCAERKDNSKREQTRDLFQKSATLARKYIDSISSAKDTASLLALSERYDKELTRLNYEYPAGTDTEMTEGENDTLTSLIVRFVNLKDSLLKAYAKTEPVDSLPTDSVTDAIPASHTGGSQKPV